jgi:hypothetical protein
MRSIPEVWKYKKFWGLSKGENLLKGAIRCIRDRENPPEQAGLLHRSACEIAGGEASPRSLAYGSITVTPVPQGNIVPDEVKALVAHIKRAQPPRESVKYRGTPLSGVGLCATLSV